MFQYFGTPIPQPPEGSDDDVDFSIPAAPDDPDLWDNVTFQKKGDKKAEPFKIFPDGMGVADVKITNRKTKTDKKGGAGKKAPKTTKTGGDLAKVAIKIKACAEAWPYVHATAKTLEVGEDEWIISHPKCAIAGIKEVLVKEWKDAPDFDDHGMIVWEFDCEEIKASAQSGKGGGSATNTPGSADGQRWKDSPAKNAGKTNPNRGAFDEQQTGVTKP